LARRVTRLARSTDLVLSSTSDSWKSKVAFLGAALTGKPIALRKETWFESRTKPRLLTRPYWYVDRRLTEFIERRAAGVLVGGRKAKEHLIARGLPAHSILPFSYLHEDLATSPSHPEVLDELRDVAPDALLLLYLGRIMPQKGLHVLIAAVRKLLADGAEVKLLVVGEPITRNTGRGAVSDDYFETCREMARGESRIRFLGPARADRVQDYYRAADVFVHPHVRTVDGIDKYDGWGNVITEAASLSTPVIASDRVASAFDIVADGISGFLLRSATLEEDLIRAIDFFCRNRAAVDAFGAKARENFEKTVDVERSMSSIRRLIERSDEPSDQSTNQHTV
jgi:glycosyltransferase involved in cell wall biosynthesis